MDRFLNERPGMDAIALVRVASLRGIVTFLARIGSPVEQLLERVGLRREVFDDDEGLIPLELGMRFLDVAARVEGIEHLGLRAGSGTSVESLGTFGRVLRHAPSLAAALEAAARLVPTFGSGERLWLEIDGDEARLCHRIVAPPSDGLRHAEAYALAIAINLVRLVAGREWLPAALRLQSTLPNRPRTQLAGVRLTDEQQVAGFAFPRALLEGGLPAPNGVPAVTDEELRRWKRSAPSLDFAGSVHQVIDALSNDLRPKIASIAAAIGLSVRSLQRRLATAGVSFDRLVDDGNLDSAAELLRGPDKIIDVAIALGYSDPAHFSRAFRRWTGLTPRDFRRQSA